MSLKYKWFLLILFLVLVLLSRFYQLDFMAFHHDESIHCYYGWKIANESPGQYQYDPVYHGPFLYHLVALFLNLFPDTDFTARMPFAVMGCLMIVMWLFLSRLVGWSVCVTTAFLLAFSPCLNYFSRFARNDIFMCAWLVGMVVFTILYLNKCRIWYLIPVSIFLVLSYCTKENSYVNNFPLGVSLLLIGIWQYFRSNSTQQVELVQRFLPLARLLLIYGCFSVFTFLYVAIDCRISPETGLWKGIINILSQTTSLTGKVDSRIFQGESGFFSGQGRAIVQISYFLVAAFLSLLILLLLDYLATAKGNQRLDLILSLTPNLAVYGFLSFRIYRYLSGLVLFPHQPPLEGLWKLLVDPLKHPSMAWMTGLWGTVVLEFLMMLFVLMVVSLGRYWYGNHGPSQSIFSLLNRVTSHSRGWLIQMLVLSIQVWLAIGIYVTLFSSLGTNPKGIRSGVYDYLAYWFKHQTGDYRIWGTWWYYVPRILLFEVFTLTLLGGSLLIRFCFKRLLDLENKNSIWLKALLGFTGFLCIYFLILYAILNEKVPWLLTYQVLSLNLFVGLWVGSLLTCLKWKLILKEPFLYKTGFGLLTIIIGASALLQGLQHAYAVYLYPDHPAELFVYTGTTGKFNERMRKVNRILDEAELQGERLKVAVEGKSEWPCAWYLRNRDCLWKTVDSTRDIQFMDDTPINRNKLMSDQNVKWEIDQVMLRGWWIWHGDPRALPGGLSFKDNLAAFLLNKRNDLRHLYPEAHRPSIEEYPVGFGRQIINYVLFRKTWYPPTGENVLVCIREDILHRWDQKSNLAKETP